LLNSLEDGGEGSGLEGQSGESEGVLHLDERSWWWRWKCGECDEKDVCEVGMATQLYIFCSRATRRRLCLVVVFALMPSSGGISMSCLRLPGTFPAVWPSSGDIPCRLAIVGHAICKICIVKCILHVDREV
jgi:hypothetical protein